MAQKIKTTCPLNCWDVCGLEVTVSNGEITQVEGDKAHEITRGFICSKGRDHVKRTYHPERIKAPLLKKEKGWDSISWEAAYHIIVEKLEKAIDYDTRSIMYYTDSAHNGMLKNVEKRFFHALGDITMASGSLCWSAGMLAQDLDFGRSVSHDYSDILNAQTIVIWGRNPAETAIHQLPYIKQAKKQGAKVIVIDPRKTPTAEMADWHISIRPGSDSALALAMANWIIANGYQDNHFIRQYVQGYDEFVQAVTHYTPDWAAKETGIAEADITALAENYAANQPATLLIGYGLQRYTNGANTVRAIDALAAITGQIGIPGGGANYANKQVAHFINASELEGDFNRNHRAVPKGELGETLLKLDAPAVDVLFVTKANPVLQAPNTDKILEAMAQIDFKVVVDLFLTDTAQAADLVLPCTSFFEETDIYFTSMGYNLVSYGPKILDNQFEAKRELEIFTDLAEYLGLDGFPKRNAEEWIKAGIQPLEEEMGITLHMLKSKPYRLPNSYYQSWKEGNFLTPSGKFELYSDQAVALGLNATAEYIPPFKTYASNASNKENPVVNKCEPEKEKTGENLYFITPHTAASIHSQHFIDVEKGTLGIVFVHPTIAQKQGIAEGEKVLLVSSAGQLQAQLKFDNTLRADTAYMYEGQWIDQGGSVNVLLKEGLSDGGEQAALYETIVSLYPADRT